jgi:two-component system phosphate regulon sensor histidine kinase PhoR
MIDLNTRRLLPSIFIAAVASGEVVVLVGWMLGLISSYHAVTGALLALFIGFVCALPFAKDFSELVARARGLGAEEVSQLPSGRRTPVGGELATALVESQRRILRMQRSMEERAVTVENVLDGVPEPLLVLDLNHRIVHANYAAELAIGSNINMRPLVDAMRSPELLDAVEAVMAGAVPEAIADIELRDHTTRSYRAIIARLANIGGGGEAAVMALQDLTAIRRLEAMRADFVANASHELRTPLANLVGFIETLEGPAKDDEAARARFLGIMKDQANRMARLVEDLLSLSRVEMDEYAPAGATDSIEDVINSVIQELDPMSQERNISFHTEVKGPLSATLGDRDLLQQVFRNLLENALKYGREGSIVQIKLVSENEAVRVSIIDEGPGIPAEHIPRLTERFYRVDVARSRSLGGTGLGLAIVKHILNRCRGHLEISSIVGRGSIFTVHLPFAEEQE